MANLIQVRAVAFMAFSLVVSCSKKADLEPVSMKPAVDSKESESTSDKITLYSWGDYFSDELRDRFKQETGIEVVYQVYDASDEMRERIKSNSADYDVVVMDDLALKRMQRTRLIRKLNKALLPNLVHIDKKHIANDSDSIYSIPYCWGTTVLAYNKLHVPEPEKSWGLLFRPDMKEHVFLIEERMECMENLLRYSGYPPETEDSSHIREAGNMLLELVSSQKARFGADADGKDGLLDGSIWAAMMYNGDVAQALHQDESSQIGYLYPEEGTTTWVDNFTVPRDTPKWKEAHAFINFMMDPVVAAESSIHVQFATANRTAREHLAKLDPELLKSAVFAEGIGNTLTEGSPERQKLIHESWGDFEKALLDRDGAVSIEGDGEESDSL